MYNTFELKFFRVETTEEPTGCLGDTLVQDEDAKTIETFKNFKEAKDVLKKYPRASYYRSDTFHGHVYITEGYGIECYEANDNGDLVEGSDFEFKE